MNAALDAHKGKALKGMKGQYSELKDYVSKALDAQALAHQKFLHDISSGVFSRESNTSSIMQLET